MPVISRGNQHRIDVGPVQHLKLVTIHDTIPVPIVGVRHFLDSLTPGALHIANRDELDILLWKHDTQIIPTTRAKTDTPQHDPFAGGNPALPSQGFGGNEIRQSQHASRRHGSF